MAFGLGDLLQTLQQGVQAMNNLTSQIKATFPQVSALSTSATTGAITFSSSQPSQFLTIITSSGGTYKTPLYLP
jgi:hypothetical protein